MELFKNSATMFAKMHMNYLPHFSTN